MPIGRSNFSAVANVGLDTSRSMSCSVSARARPGRAANHRLGAGIERSGRHLSCGGTGQAEHRHPRRGLPQRCAQPARAQPGSGVVGAPARRRDQDPFCHQCGAAQQVQRHARQRHQALPEPVDRDGPGDGRTDRHGEKVQAGSGARGEQIFNCNRCAACAASLAVSAHQSLP